MTNQMRDFRNALSDNIPERMTRSNVSEPELKYNLNILLTENYQLFTTKNEL